MSPERQRRRAARARRLGAGAAVLLLALAAALGYRGLWQSAPVPVDTPISVRGVLAGDPGEFARASGPWAFQFPRDHGPHPEYRSEWWYFTGNLADPAGRRFGFQLTLFRFGLVARPPERASAWGASQVFMGHFALTDVGAGRFHAHERLARQALGLAGAQLAPLRVWVEDWAIEALPGEQGFRVRAAQDGVALALELRPAKGVVLHGDAGLSQKSAEPGNASYYYSYTRLAAQGTVTLADGVARAVQGLAWMDREWSTSALGPGQAGWDWFALQLDDGQDVMFYQLRRADGTPDPHSQGTLVAADGSARSLRVDEVHLEVLGTWASARDGARYPARWRLRVPGVDLALEVEPLLADQELALSVRYWEGAVRVRGTQRGRPLAGYGYVELTGYPQPGSENASR
jgi:predicted secreted hydrolase